MKWAMSPIRLKVHFLRFLNLTIYDVVGEQAEISGETRTFLPRFEIQPGNGDHFYIRKKLTLFWDKYEFDNLWPS